MKDIKKGGGVEQRSKNFNSREKLPGKKNKKTILLPSKNVI